MLYKSQSVKEFPIKATTKQQLNAETDTIIVENTAYNEVNKSILIIYIIQQGVYYILTNQNTPPPLISKYSYR